METLKKGLDGIERVVKEYGQIQILQNKQTDMVMQIRKDGQIEDVEQRSDHYLTDTNES